MSGVRCRYPPSTTKAPPNRARLISVAALCDAARTLEPSFLELHYFLGCGGQCDILGRGEQRLPCPACQKQGGGFRV